MGIVDEIKLSFKNGSYLIKLIYLNIAIWLAIRLTFVGYSLSGSDATLFLGYFALPASFDLFIKRPWTLITYMALRNESDSPLENFPNDLDNSITCSW